MRISIHQPNFFPWYPFFQKMSMCDKFVILTNCQYEKNGFQNRFNIDGEWRTMSVHKGLVNLSEKKYSNPIYDWNKIKKQSFKYKDVLEIFDDCISENLMETNVKIIKKIKDILNINCEVVFDKPTEFKSTERLIEICSYYGATEYISGPSGKNYLNLKNFNDKKIKVLFQDEISVEKSPIIKTLQNYL